MAKQELVGKMCLEGSKSCFVSICQAHRSKKHVTGGHGVTGGLGFGVGCIVQCGSHRVKSTNVAAVVVLNGFRKGTETINVVSHFLFAALATVHEACKHRTH